MQPRVAVVVLTYGSEAEAADCFRSLAQSSYPSLTIVHVDNDSPDGAYERLCREFPDVVHIQTGANLGYAAGNNRGFAWALENGAEYVMVLNDDTIVDPQCVSRLVAAAEETGAAAVAPLITYYDEPNIVWYAGGSYSRARDVQASSRERARAARPGTRADNISLRLLLPCSRRGASQPRRI
jgi:GT2 family glycosyltransferase